MSKSFLAYKKNQLVFICYSKTEILIKNGQDVREIYLGLDVVVDWNIQNNEYTGFSLNGSLFNASHEDLVLFRNQIRGHVTFLQLFKHYRLIKAIGKGGQSEGVYQVQDRLTNKFYAMKQIKRTKEIFHSEILILNRLRHPNIVTLFEVFQNEEHVQIILEDLKPLTFKARDEEWLQQNLKQLVKAVHFLHKNGIMHRDIKLENIMQDSKGTLKLIDFGLATYDDQRLTKCGTPGYIAPEVFTQNNYSKKCDLFSLGVVMFEMFFNFPLFDGRTPFQIQRKNFRCELLLDNIVGLTEAAHDLLTKLLQKNPENRYGAEEALSHEFFDQDCGISSPQSMPPKFLTHIEEGINMRSFEL